MNQCYGCTTCSSADKPLEGFIRNLPMETSHHRVEGQSTKCGFGLQGVCCRLCSNGPCRITPKAPRGICGATAGQKNAGSYGRLQHQPAALGKGKKRPERRTCAVSGASDHLRQRGRDQFLYSRGILEP